MNPRLMSYSEMHIVVPLYVLLPLYAYVHIYAYHYFCGHVCACASGVTECLPSTWTSATRCQQVLAWPLMRPRLPATTSSSPVLSTRRSRQCRVPLSSWRRSSSRSMPRSSPSALATARRSVVRFLRFPVLRPWCRFSRVPPVSTTRTPPFSSLARCSACRCPRTCLAVPLTAQVSPSTRAHRCCPRNTWTSWVCPSTPRRVSTPRR
mmetsp:Transcript_71597/g.116074  ORF Transcript_71597/g.116074 Transcript_71597/m.116074 type:complete len:207 (-) Transcript_71597:1713-2333(-)